MSTKSGGGDLTRFSVCPFLPHESCIQVMLNASSSSSMHPRRAHCLLLIAGDQQDLASRTAWLVVGSGLIVRAEVRWLPSPCPVGAALKQSVNVRSIDTDELRLAWERRCAGCQSIIKSSDRGNKCPIHGHKLSDLLHRHDVLAVFPVSRVPQDGIECPW